MSLEDRFKKARESSLQNDKDTSISRKSETDKAAQLREQHLDPIIDAINNSIADGNGVIRKSGGHINIQWNKTEDYDAEYFKYCYFINFSGWH